MRQNWLYYQQSVTISLYVHNTNPLNGSTVFKFFYPFPVSAVDLKVIKLKGIRLVKHMAITARITKRDILQLQSLSENKLSLNEQLIY